MPVDELAGLTPVLVGVSLLMGLVVGSFLNVIIHRVPLGLSIVTPGSACPNCHHQLRTRDNIPVVSWLMLRGRCRDCEHPISVRYPLVEAGTGMAFAVATWVLIATVSSGLLVWIVFSWIVISFAISLMAIDIDVHRLPNSLTVPFLVVVVIGMPVAAAAGGSTLTQMPLARASISALCWLWIYGLLWLGAPIAFGKPGMGVGDVKLAPTLGFLTGWVGWSASIVGFFAAYFVGLIIAIPIMMSRRAVDADADTKSDADRGSRRDTYVAHGPNMLIGAAIGMFLGAAVTNLLT